MSGRTDCGYWGAVTEVAVERHLVETEGLGEISAGACWRGRSPGLFGPCCPAWLGSTGSPLSESLMQTLGCRPGGCCLRCVLLRVSEFGDRRRQVDEFCCQGGSHEGATAASFTRQGDEPRN